MGGVIRINCSETQTNVTSGEALLVCAYDNDEKFNNNHLDGAIPFAVFSKMTAELPKDKEIVFY